MVLRKNRLQPFFSYECEEHYVPICVSIQPEKTSAPVL